MRAFAAAVVCSALLAGGIYVGGRSVGVWNDATPAPTAAPKVTAAQKRANKPTIWLNGRDQRAARAAVMTKADLGALWKGGTAKVDFSYKVACPNYRPRAWDLQITGAAATHFSHVGALDLRSEARVMQSPRMVRLDAKRTFEHPNVLSCLRRLFSPVTARAGGTLVSLNRRPFPKIAPYTARFRVISRVNPNPGPKIAFLTDIVVLGKGRHEVTLTITAPLRERAALDEAEVSWAKLLLSRVRS
jgi:hypothetical protein